MSGPLLMGNAPQYRRGTNDPHGYVNLATRALCPVVAECLAFALAGNVGYGVWGGTTAAERYKLRRVLR